MFDIELWNWYDEKCFDTLENVLDKCCRLSHMNVFLVPTKDISSKKQN